MQKTLGKGSINYRLLVSLLDIDQRTGGFSIEEYKLGAVETRFADLIWQHEPLTSGELVRLCQQELDWEKIDYLYAASESMEHEPGRQRSHPRCPVARLALKRAPKVFSYALWAVVRFRLLCPVSLSSVHSRYFTVYFRIQFSSSSSRRMRLRGLPARERLWFSPLNTTRRVSVPVRETAVYICTPCSSGQR